MICCLNPDCENPINDEDREFCLNCGSPLIRRLRGRYSVMRPLDRGGMSRTYLAVDEDKLRTYCVIKQFSPNSLATGVSRQESISKSVTLFNQEAHRLHELGSHGQIPCLLAYFEEDNRLYLVQELIRGWNLWQELRHEGAFGEDKIWQLLRGLLPVLQFVHDRDVVHRDIKPTNILRRKRDGKFVLIDFGVAKRLTKTGNPGTKVGTQGYAAMEQVRSGRAYPASDLYSLGVTCIHLLTAMPPDDLFDPLTGRWLWQEMLQKQGLPISARLKQILDKLLKETVSERYQSVAEVLRDLNGTGPVAPTPIINGICKNWKCVNTLTGHADKIRFVAISPNNILASASGDKTIGLWQLGRNATEAPSHLGILKGHSGSVGSLAISPHGKILASGGNDNEIKLWSLSNNGNGSQLLETLTGHAGWVEAIAFNPRVSILASGGNDNKIKLWKLERGEWIKEPIMTIEGHTNGVKAIAFRSDGEILASGSEDKTINIWHLRTGKLLLTFSRHLNRVNAIAFSPDGNILVSGSDDGTLKLWDIASGKMISTLTEHDDGVMAIAFSTDGKILASASRDRTIKIWQLETHKAVATLTDHEWWVQAIAFSQDGRTIVSGSGDNTLKIWRYD
ncbi:MAG: protein kinase [Hormoscilla sp.]